MRLHYLHLPRYGPLRRLRCVFRQNTLLPGRCGAVNFVVGVNGTGKSSLLRALYHTFQCLEQDDAPPFPVTLAFTNIYNFTQEKPSGSHNLLVLLDCPPDRTKSRIQLWSLGEQTGQALASYDIYRWDRVINAMRVGDTTEPPLASQLEADIPREKWGGNNAVDAALPSRVVAYTSGDPQPWRRLAESEFDSTEIAPDWLKPEEYNNERPPRWSARDERREQIHQLAESMADAISAYAEEYGPDAGTAVEPLAEKFASMRDIADRAREILKIDDYRRYITPSSTVLGSADLRLAGVAVGLWNACEELRGRKTEEERTAFQKLLRQSPELRDGPSARLFNSLDWAWPTHLSMMVNPSAEPRDEENLARILALHGLAATVLRQPLNRLQLVIPLGARGDARSISELFKTLQLKHPLADDLAARADTSANGAEAVVRLFDNDREPWPLFEALKAWRESGWLEEATVTVLRIRAHREDNEEDDAVHCLDDFSDGERELLGRTSLLFLLRKQVNTLLLLDEPETHFNDEWKREVVDLVDDHLLKTTPCQVIASTHSSIALTDVFTEEILALEIDPETSAPRERHLVAATFGAAPGEIMRRVFGVDDTVGRRAMEFLDALLTVSADPEALAEMWSLLDEPNQLMRTRAFRRLWARLWLRPSDSFGTRPNPHHIAAVLHELRQLAGAEGTPQDALNRLSENVGAGHYRLELARRLFTAEQPPDAPQS